MRWLAFLIGMLPDLLAFTPMFIYLFVTGRFGDRSWMGREMTHWVFDWAPFAYSYTHSLVIFTVTYLIVYFVRGRQHPVILWPWAFHILLDIPTHPDFYRTPWLFPISDYKFPWGVSWGNPFIFFTNWILLIGWYGHWLFFLRKRDGIISN